MDTTFKKYLLHKSSAKSRGIEFDLTFDEWKSIWGFHIENRGTRANQLGMLRTRDEGGYSVGNVRLGTPKENQQERSVALKVSKAQSAWQASEVKNTTVPAHTSWVKSRNYVFDEYVEDDE